MCRGCDRDGAGADARALVDRDAARLGYHRPALAPLIVGWASDRLQPGLGPDALRYGMATMAPTPAFAGLLLWRVYARQRAAVAGDARADRAAVAS